MTKTLTEEELKKLKEKEEEERRAREASEASSIDNKHENKITIGTKKEEEATTTQDKGPYIQIDQEKEGATKQEQIKDENDRIFKGVKREAFDTIKADYEKSGFEVEIKEEKDGSRHMKIYVADQAKLTEIGNAIRDTIKNWKDNDRTLESSKDKDQKESSENENSKRVNKKEKDQPEEEQGTNVDKDGKKNKENQKKGFLDEIFGEFMSVAKKLAGVKDEEEEKNENRSSSKKLLRFMIGAFIVAAAPLILPAIMMARVGLQLIEEDNKGVGEEKQGQLKEQVENSQKKETQQNVVEQNNKDMKEVKEKPEEKEIDGYWDKAADFVNEFSALSNNGAENQKTDQEKTSEQQTNIEAPDQKKAQQISDRHNSKAEIVNENEATSKPKPETKIDLNGLDLDLKGVFGQIELSDAENNENHDFPTGLTTSNQKNSFSRQ